jgi:chaperone modulatory protein CbpM
LDRRKSRRSAHWDGAVNDRSAAVLDRTRLEIETLEVWIKEEWLIPREDAVGQKFSDADIARAHLIKDLKQDFGVNDEGIGVILNLIDQVHGLRRTLRDLLQTVRNKTEP